MSTPTENKVLHIFLDVHGVLVEHGSFSRMYRETMVRLLQDRYGGPARIWRLAHDQAGRRWVEAMNTALEHHGDRSYDEIYTGLQGDWISWVFDIVRSYGVRVPQLSTEEAYRLGNELGHTIPASFRSVPPQNADAVRALRQPPFRDRVKLYVATNAHSQHATGVLESAGLQDCFDGICTPDTLGCFFKNRAYWERAFAYAGAEARDCLVADDEEKKGIADPHALGAITVLVNERRYRRGNPADEHDPSTGRRATRRSAADFRIPDLPGLPPLVEYLLAGRDKPST